SICPVHGSTLLFRSHLAPDASREAANELLLRDDEEEEDREQRDENRGEYKVPLREILADERVHRERQGLMATAAEKDQRDEEVVPDEQAGQDCNGSGDRTQERKHHADIRAKRSRSVDPGGLFVISRQSSYEARIEKHRQRTQDSC